MTEHEWLLSLADALQRSRPAPRKCSTNGCTTTVFRRAKCEPCLREWEVEKNRQWRASRRGATSKA